MVRSVREIEVSRNRERNSGRSDISAEGIHRMGIQDLGDGKIWERK